MRSVRRTTIKVYASVAKVACYLLIDCGFPLGSRMQFLFRRHFRTILFGLVGFPSGTRRTQRADNIFSFIAFSTVRHLVFPKPFKCCRLHDVEVNRQTIVMGEL